MTIVKRASRIKAAERVAAALRREIAIGNLRPGDRMAPERELQVQFEVSRPTLREALRLLEAESLIEIGRGQQGGARVTKLNISTVAQQVGLCLQINGVSLLDVWNSRTILESWAAGALARSRNAQAIAELEENIAQAHSAAEDSLQHGTLVDAYSRTLTRYCGNQTIHIFVDLLLEIITRQYIEEPIRSYFQQRGLDRWREPSIRNREKLLEMIRQGRASEAEEFWKHCLIQSGNVVLSAYRGQMPIDVARIPPGTEVARLDRLRTTLNNSSDGTGKPATARKRPPQSSKPAEKRGPVKEERAAKRAVGDRASPALRQD